MCTELFPGSWAYYMSDSVGVKPAVYDLYDFVNAIQSKEINPQSGRYVLFKNRAPIELDFDIFKPRPYFKDSAELLEYIAKPEFVDIQVFWFKRKGDKNGSKRRKRKNQRDQELT